MHEFSKKLAQYCEQHLNLSPTITCDYQSLSVCILDCVYSLRAKYYAVTLPIVDRYAEQYMGGDKLAPGDTASMLIQNIDKIGGPKSFADKVTRNHQKLGGKKSIPKENVCYQLANYLRILHIETIEDFRNFESPELLEAVIRAVDGMGDAGVNYLFMLAGDADRCKPDVHIHHCIVDACGKDVSNEECQILFTEAVQCMNATYPALTVRKLDGIVWRYYQEKSAKTYK